MSPDTSDCPFEGIYAVIVPEGGLYDGLNERQMNPSNEKTLLVCSEHSSLNSRCNSNDHIQLQSKCTFNDNIRSKLKINCFHNSTNIWFKDFRCRGGWKENGTNYLIASSNEDDIRQYCLAYDETGNQLQMTISSETCLRKTANPISSSQPHRESHLALSLVNKGLHKLIGF